MIVRDRRPCQGRKRRKFVTATGTDTLQIREARISHFPAKGSVPPAHRITLYSTYLGGAEGSTQGYSIGFDHLGDTFVGGTTTAGLFPDVPVTTVKPSAGFLTKLHPKLMTMAYTTFLGADVYGIDITDPVSTTGTYSASGATIYAVGDRYIPNSDTTQVSNLDAFVVTQLDTP